MSWCFQVSKGIYRSSPSNILFHYMKIAFLADFKNDGWKDTRNEIYDRKAGSIAVCVGCN